MIVYNSPDSCAVIYYTIYACAIDLTAYNMNNNLSIVTFDEYITLIRHVYHRHGQWWVPRLTICKTINENQMYTSKCSGKWKARPGCRVLRSPLKKLSLHPDSWLVVMLNASYRLTYELSHITHTKHAYT